MYIEVSHPDKEVHRSCYCRGITLYSDKSCHYGITKSLMCGFQAPIVQSQRWELCGSTFSEPILGLPSTFSISLGLITLWFGIKLYFCYPFICCRYPPQWDLYAGADECLKPICCFMCSFFRQMEVIIQCLMDLCAKELSVFFLSFLFCFFFNQDLTMEFDTSNFSSNHCHLYNVFVNRHRRTRLRSGLLLGGNLRVICVNSPSDLLQHVDMAPINCSISVPMSYFQE